MKGGDAGFLRRKTRPTYEAPDGIRIVDLFSGCGGMTLGTMEACRSLGLGATVRLAMELDDDVRAVYSANFDSSIEEEVANVRRRFDRQVGSALSVRETETRKAVGRTDILVGGPPCQGHSNLNNHTRWADPKNALYMRMIRAAEVLEPHALMIENVPGIRKDEQRVLGRARRRLVGLGYHISEGTVAVAEIGVPQLRVRHVLIAAQRPLLRIDEIVDMHVIQRPRPLRWALAKLRLQGDGGTFDTAASISKKNLARARWLIRHDEFDLPNSKRPPCHANNPDHTYKSMYGRLNWDQPAQTITTGFGSPGQGRYIHPEKPRTLTPHEAARIQFFPDWFDFSPAPSRTILARCIGNAVPPKLAFVLARAVLGAREQSQDAVDSAPVPSAKRRVADGRLSIALPRGEPLVTPDPRRK